jgi:hypothetical protein
MSLNSLDKRLAKIERANGAGFFTLLLRHNEAREKAKKKSGDNPRANATVLHIRSTIRTMATFEVAKALTTNTAIT